MRRKSPERSRFYESPTYLSLVGRIATNVRLHREQRGWTQAELARKLGVAEQQVQRDEANRYAGAALARLCTIAEALDIDVSETITLRAG